MTEPPPERKHQSASTQPEKPSLNRALDTLENMLDPQQKADSEQELKPDPAVVGEVADPRGTYAAGKGNKASNPPLDGQYTIPLLDDVVLTGPPLSESDEPEGPDSSSPSITDDEDYQRLVQRLTSELEVIVQAAVEDALQKAHKRINRQVKDHIDIMLPEILEELARLKDREDP